ncbi:MAG: hypothetical protein Q8R28_03170 [Dehalococcoidia bacterium]|nr:hypothetical protein [Dehalococcoidia bacterium]
MEEARASWNTIYLDRNGFECQITLRDENEGSLAERVSAVTDRLVRAGGAPVLRHNNHGSRNHRSPPEESQGTDRGSPNGSPHEKTYLDAKGIRRCNLKLKSGRRCNEAVTEKEGRYGLFWSCPNYKEHVPPPPNQH